MRRRLLVILSVVAALLLAGAVVVQIVLWTDVPRRLVLDALADQTGLRVSAGSLRTGWLGRTVVRDLELGLPLEADPFVTVPRISVSHTGLLRLALFRDLSVESIELVEPRVDLRQDARGRWNALDALDLVRSRQSGDNTGDAPDLPRVDVVGLHLDVTVADGRRTTYGPIVFRGGADASKTWAFTLDLGSRQTAQGAVAAGGTWRHRVTLDVPDAAELLAPWLDSPPPPTSIAGEWRGEVTDDGVTGRADLAPLRVDDVTVEGGLTVTTQGRSVTLSPDRLQVTVAGIPAQVGGGAVRATMDPWAVRAERVELAALDTVIHLDADWDGVARVGNVAAQWTGGLPAGVNHSGSIAARLTAPALGEPALAGDIAWRGSSPAGAWDGLWHLAAHGPDWRTVTAEVQTPRLTLARDADRVDLAGIFVQADVRWPLVTLTQLRVPAAEARGSATFDAASGDWSIDLAAADWQPPGLDAGPLNAQLRVRGKQQRITLDTFTASGDGFSLHAAGSYVTTEPQPLRLDASADVTLNRDGLAGAWRAGFAAAGTVSPLDLQLDGRLDAADVTWNSRPVEPLRIPLRGRFNAAGGEVRSDEVRWLDGAWRIAATYDRAANRVDATLDESGLSVQRVVELLGLPVPVTGTFDAELQAALPELDPAQLRVAGRWEVEALRGPRLTFDGGGGQLEFAGENLAFHDMTLARGDGAMTGRVAFNVRRAHQLDVDVRFNDWAADAPELGLAGRLNGQAQLKLDVVALTADGRVALDGDVTLDGDPLAQMQLHADVAGRTIDLQRFAAAGLRGNAEGSGRLHLTEDDWTGSTLDLAWSGVDLTCIPLQWREQPALTGASSGTLRLARAEDPRAVEPMQLDVAVTHSGARYGPAALGDASILAYLGRDRAVLQRGELQALGGTVNFWGRLTAHEGNPFVHLDLDLDQIDTQQIADIVGYDARPVPGRMSGHGVVGGYLKQPHRRFGQADVRLTDSDLAAMPGLSQLYSAMSIDFSRSQPTGHGRAVVRLEGEALDVARLSYFNRGTDVVASLRIHDLRLGRASPISGVAAGSARPLRDTALPLLGEDLDRMIRAIQTDLVTLRIGGTLDDQQTQVAPLEEITGAFNRILFGTPP